MRLGENVTYALERTRRRLAASSLRPPLDGKTRIREALVVFYRYFPQLPLTENSTTSVLELRILGLMLCGEALGAPA